MIIRRLMYGEKKRPYYPLLVSPWNWRENQSSKVGHVLALHSHWPPLPSDAGGSPRLKQSYHWSHLVIYLSTWLEIRIKIWYVKLSRFLTNVLSHCKVDLCCSGTTMPTTSRSSVSHIVPYRLPASSSLPQTLQQTLVEQWAAHITIRGF